MTSSAPRPTTNAHDQQQVARLQARLRTSTRRRLGRGNVPDAVTLAPGAHKYVLLQASSDDTGTQYFVTSRQNAAYHRNAAEPMIAQLEEAGFYDIEVTGGGRIRLNEEEQRISIFGFSYGFGPADHAISRRIVLEDPRYRDFDVQTSNDGY